MPCVFNFFLNNPPVLFVFIHLPFLKQHNRAQSWSQLIWSLRALSLQKVLIWWCWACKGTDLDLDLGANLIPSSWPLLPDLLSLWLGQVVWLFWGPFLTCSIQWFISQGCCKLECMHNTWYVITQQMVMAVTVLEYSQKISSGLSTIQPFDSFQTNYISTLCFNLFRIFHAVVAPVWEYKPYLSCKFKQVLVQWSRGPWELQKFLGKNSSST